jgi:hypothetical protein
VRKLKDFTPKVNDIRGHQVLTETSVGSGFAKVSIGSNKGDLQGVGLGISETKSRPWNPRYTASASIAENSCRSSSG